MSQDKIAEAETVELLTFQLSEQEYSLNIMNVREIRSWTKATPMPHAPSFMRGVINLRGSVVPVVDLKSQFEMGSTELTIDSCIIIYLQIMYILYLKTIMCSTC
mgnify:CR=1 FL=1